MGRAAHRRSHGPGRDRDRYGFVGTGTMVEVTPRIKQREPEDPGFGRHLWVVTAAWKVNPARLYSDAERSYLDTENLIVMNPPACYKCELIYTADLEARRCMGSMDLQ